MMDAELAQMFAETAGELKMASADLVRLTSTIGRQAQDLVGHQVQIDRHAEKIAKLAAANPEALAESRRANDTARTTRDRVDLALGILESHGVALAALKKTLHAHGGMLKRLLSLTAGRSKPKPRLKVLRGGRSSPPGPAPKRRG